MVRFRRSPRRWSVIRTSDREGSWLLMGSPRVVMVNVVSQRERRNTQSLPESIAHSTNAKKARPVKCDGNPTWIDPEGAVVNATGEKIHILGVGADGLAGL